MEEPPFIPSNGHNDDDLLEGDNPFPPPPGPLPFPEGTNNDRCAEGPGVNTVLNCEVTR